jgi:hypothetical protein
VLIEVPWHLPRGTTENRRSLIQSDGSLGHFLNATLERSHYQNPISICYKKVTKMKLAIERLLLADPPIGRINTVCNQISPIDVKILFYYTHEKRASE